MHLSFSIYSTTSFSHVFTSSLQSLKQEEECPLFPLFIYSTEETQIGQLAAFNSSSAATKCLLPH